MSGYVDLEKRLNIPSHILLQQVNRIASISREKMSGIRPPHWFWLHSVVKQNKVDQCVLVMQDASRSHSRAWRDQYLKWWPQSKTAERRSPPSKRDCRNSINKNGVKGDGRRSRSAVLIRPSRGKSRNQLATEPTIKGQRKIHGNPARRWETSPQSGQKRRRRTADTRHYGKT